jgi:hypothetical protein
MTGSGYMHDIGCKLAEQIDVHEGLQYVGMLAGSENNPTEERARVLTHC